MSCRVCGSPLVSRAVRCGTCGSQTPRSAEGAIPTGPSPSQDRPVEEPQPADESSEGAESSTPSLADDLPANDGIEVAEVLPELEAAEEEIFSSVPAEDLSSAAALEEIYRLPLPALAVPADPLADGPGARQPPALPPIPAPLSRRPVALPDPPQSLDDSIEHTRIVQREATRTFALKVSTGEVHRVRGHALLGRRPTAQPGEQPQLLPINDPGRSVSKTHLEIGIDDGKLWICDRYSANGTSVVGQSGYGKILQPGRRYHLDDGDRVEIGDQWFSVTPL